MNDIIIKAVVIVIIVGGIIGGIIYENLPDKKPKDDNDTIDTNN